jgi:hypothetical protein
MCDVPSIAVFCSESIECFPGIASRFFLKLFVTIPVAPLLLLLLLLLLTAIELSLGGSSRYTSTDKTNKNQYT